MKRLALSVVLVALFAAACDQATTDPPVEAPEEAAFKKAQSAPVDQSPVTRDLSEWNDKIAAAGKGVAIAYYEYITAPGSDRIGRLVFASDRGNKQLGSHWVPNDPRSGTGTVVQYLVDDADGATSSGLTDAETTAAIDAGVQTWDDITCSNIPLVNLGTTDFDAGYVQWLFGFGGIAGFFPGTILHAGWLPGAFFDAVEPGGSSFILGVTFTFVWVSPEDLDGNGKEDVAFKEIYYNNAFPWFTDGTAYDVETVAHHEFGHGLSQAHFGDIFGTFANGKIHFAPRAVMNAAYSGVQRSPTGTDNAGHCSIWAQWPNN